jgi:hypothetical protein
MRLIVSLLFCISISIYILIPIHSKPIYKKDLRNMHNVQKNKIIAHTIITDYNRIYQQIYQSAQIGNTECQFDLQCKHSIDRNGECIINNYESFRGYSNLFQSYSSIKFDFPYKSYTYILLQKINKTFPDSKIIQIKKPCCSYIISW